MRICANRGEDCPIQTPARVVYKPRQWEGRTKRGAQERTDVCLLLLSTRVPRIHQAEGSWPSWYIEEYNQD